MPALSFIARTDDGKTLAPVGLILRIPLREDSECELRQLYGPTGNCVNTGDLSEVGMNANFGLDTEG